MREKQIEAIRAACIKANPEIMELKFGCWVKTAAFGMPETEGELIQTIDDGSWVIHSKDFGVFGHFQPEDLEIVGRPIRLADVLSAIEPFTRRAKLNAAATNIVEHWRLHHDDLTQQSDECIRFLADLLHD